MRFRTGSSLDPSQISDRRGMRAGPMAAGGVGGLGLIGLLIVLGIQLLGGSSGGGGFLTNQVPYGNQSGQVSGATAECRTGADAEASARTAASSPS